MDSEEDAELGDLVSASRGARRAMNVSLSVDEMEFLEEIAQRRGISKNAALRHALRLYQLIDERLKRGDRIFFEHPLTKEKAEVMLV